MNAGDKASLLEMLASKRKTPNGVFGIKVTSTHVRAFGERAFFAFSTRARFSTYFSGAISSRRAFRRFARWRRGAFHDHGAHTPPYDEAKIAYWIEHVLEIENENCLLLSRQSRAPPVVTYEELCGGRDRAIELFHPDDNPSPLPAVTDLTKIGDSWNLDAEQRFRASRGAFTADVE